MFIREPTSQLWRSLQGVTFIQLLLPSVAWALTQSFPMATPRGAVSRISFAYEVSRETSGHFTRRTQAHAHARRRLVRAAQALIANNGARRRRSRDQAEREATRMSGYTPRREPATNACTFEVLDKTGSSEIEICRRCGCVAIHVGPMTMRLDLASFDALTMGMRRAAYLLSQESKAIAPERAEVLS